MHDRPADYARCTAALIEDSGRGGAAAIFDQALTNALAAIVAARWPGEEIVGRRVKSACDLLGVIEAQGTAVEDRIYVLEDLNPPPPGGEIFGGPLAPEPTLVRAGVLREAVDITQPPRHARRDEVQPLRAEHLEALKGLNADASLRVSFEDLDIDEREEQVALADAREQARARAYIELLSPEEWERREAVDYEADYTEVEDGERYAPHECAVCGLQALLEDARDSYLDEIAAGTCLACSYKKSYEVADLEGRDDAINRAVSDPRT